MLTLSFGIEFLALSDDAILFTLTPGNDYFVFTLTIYNKTHKTILHSDKLKILINTFKSLTKLNDRTVG